MGMDVQYYVLVCIEIAQIFCRQVGAMMAALRRIVPVFGSTLYKDRHITALHIPTP